MNFHTDLNYKQIRLFFYAIISILISIYLINLSDEKDSWLNFWYNFNVPTMWPPFTDIDHIRNSLICRQSGIDPFISNPCDVSNSRYQYPVTWLHIFEILSLENFKNYQVFLIVSLSLLLFYYFLLIEITIKKINKIGLFLLFFSTSSCLLIERGNVDHIIFILIFSLIIFSGYYSALFLIFLSSLLKIYPFFSFFYLIRSKHKILITLILMIVTIYFLYEISLSKYIDKNHSIMAMSQTYGVQSITEGFFKVIEKKNILFLEEVQKNLIRLLASLIALFFAAYFFYRGTISKIKINYKKNENKEILFVLGSSIYIGTYIFYSNIDYRLVFLFMTIPFMENFEKKINHIYLFSVLIISNSFMFAYNPLTLEHILYTTLLYSIKLCIFIFLCFSLGLLSKDFFNLKKSNFI